MKNYGNFICEKYEEIKSKHDLLDLLESAIDNSDLNLVKLIIDLDVKLDDYLISYLRYSVFPKESLKILKLLIDNGIDINHIFYVNGLTGDVTISHLFAMSENKNVSHLIDLYRMGADFFIPSSKGKTVWYDLLDDKERKTLLTKIPELEIRIESDKFNI